MIKAIIIDDEQHAIEAISILLEAFESDINLIGVSQSVSKGIEMINLLEPDLVFLDIELKDGIGFEVAEKTAYHNYKLIFTTAYDQYAIKAFKVKAMDYLLKPIDISEFQATMKRCIQEINQNQVGVVQKNSFDEKIRIPETDGYRLISATDVLYLQADSNYTRIHIKSGKTFIVSRTLKDFEGKMDPSRFVRVHHSYIVNINEIFQLSKGEPSSIKMCDGEIIPVSRSRKTALISILAGK